MKQIPLDAILADDSVEAGVLAMEEVHARHLPDMTPEEQEAARAHWRVQVEQVLTAVHARFAGRIRDDRGRAILTFADNEDGGIDVSATFLPELHELDDGELDGTPAQVVAIVSLQSLEDEDEDEP